MEPTLIWILVSVLGGFVLALLLGRGLVPALRALKAGQSIREVGPQWHQGQGGHADHGRHRVHCRDHPLHSRLRLEEP